ncbi:MAG: SDR family oxidoreductase [bacterium]
MKIENKTFLITGGGSGIGRALVLALLKKGAQVAVVDINDATLLETKKLAGVDDEKISTHVVDITDKEAVTALPQEVVKFHGQIDGLINNAGIIQPFVKVNDLEYEAIDKVMNVNFYGTLFMVKAFLPYLIKRAEAYIVNVSSMGGFLPVPGQSVYGASKAAVKLLTEGLYAELKDTGVHVSVVFPGATNTNITKNSGVQGPSDAEESSQNNFSMTSPENAAATIITGIEKNKTRILIGKDSKMMNKLYRLAPNFATNLIAKQMSSLLKVDKK